MSNNLHLLLKLLIAEDDREIIAHISKELVKMGGSIVADLQKVADSHTDVMVIDTIEEIIHKIHCQELSPELTHWAKYRDEDLLEGLLLVASFQYCDMAINEITEHLAELIRCATDDVSPTYATSRAVSIISHNIYHLFEYRVASEADCSHDIRLYYINDILARRKTCPTLMAAIYYLCTKQLNIPTWFIDTPNELTLGFGQRIVRPKEGNSYKSKKNNALKIDFFLNIHTGNIDSFDTFKAKLENSDISDPLGCLIPVDNKRVVQRLFEELAQIYKNSRNRARYTELKKLAQILN